MGFGPLPYAKLTTIGDLLTHDGTVEERLASDYGVGYNFLNVLYDGSLRWLDIQAIIQYISGGLNVMILLPLLAIPRPAVVVSTAEDHSGGAHVATPAEAIPTPAVAETVAEDHSGGGETATPTLAIPVPAVSGVAAVV